MCKRTFWKFIDILPVFLRAKRQKERRALSLGGRTAGRASDLRKRALDLMGKKEDRGSPFLIFTSNPSASTATAPPQRQRGRCCEDAGENSLLKESPPPPPPPPLGAKHTQWSMSRQWRIPREPTLHASLPVRPSQKLCVSRSWYSVGREENTVCNVIYFRPYLPLICLLSSLFLPFLSFPFLFPFFLWQTIVGDSQNIYVTDTHRELCWMTKSWRRLHVTCF